MSNCCCCRFRSRFPLSRYQFRDVGSFALSIICSSWVCVQEYNLDHLISDQCCQKVTAFWEDCILPADGSANLSRPVSLGTHESVEITWTAALQDKTTWYNPGPLMFCRKNEIFECQAQHHPVQPARQKRHDACGFCSDLGGSNPGEEYAMLHACQIQLWVKVKIIWMTRPAPYGWIKRLISSKLGSSDQKSILESPASVREKFGLPWGFARGMCANDVDIHPG